MDTPKSCLSVPCSPENNIRYFFGGDGVKGKGGRVEEGENIHTYINTYIKTYMHTLHIYTHMSTHMCVLYYSN